MIYADIASARIHVDGKATIFHRMRGDPWLAMVAVAPVSDGPLCRADPAITESVAAFLVARARLTVRHGAAFINAMGRPAAARPDKPEPAYKAKERDGLHVRFRHFMVWAAVIEQAPMAGGSHGVLTQRSDLKMALTTARPGRIRTRTCVQRTPHDGSMICIGRRGRERTRIDRSSSIAAHSLLPILARSAPGRKTHRRTRCHRCTLDPARSWTMPAEWDLPYGGCDVCRTAGPPHPVAQRELSRKRWRRLRPWPSNRTLHTPGPSLR